MRFSEIKKHLSSFRVGIAGAGGLGSNCAAALARSGVGTIVIADFDRVERLNLNRQFYFEDQLGMLKTDALKINLHKIDRSLNIITHALELTPDNIGAVFSGCDIIIEAFDGAEMKRMLIETVQNKMPGVPMIVGSGMSGWGMNELIRTRMIDESLYLCGDEQTEATDDNPPMAPRVGIVANMQANVVIDILMKKTGRLQ